MASTRSSRLAPVVDMAEKAEKTGIWPDMSQFLKSPKFEHKIIKSYPEMKEQYQDKIGWDFFVYDENIKFNWKILPEKEKIGDYNTQKATTDFAGREWTAWFAAEIPFQDGPYKFYGLPGLIVKIEDSGKNYSWILDGNKKIENYDEASCVQRIFETEDRHFNVTTKEKFVKAYEEHRADPLRELKARITPEEMNGIMPGGTETVRAALKNEEKKTQDFLNANNNPIEIIQPRNKKEK